MSLLFFSPRPAQPSPSGDWRQQELAEIYRVLHLLQQNGLGVDLDRGVTDKGEPWAVFFDPTGEDVFLHLARLSGDYIMVSEPLNVRVKASNFRQAVDQFENAISGKLQQNRERAGNVVSHPSAQLLFSLVAVFLVVKSKAAQAHDGSGEDNALAEISNSQLAKIRAVLARLQESVDNPVLMAAMVGAIVVTVGVVRDDLNKIVDETPTHVEASAPQKTDQTDKVTLADASKKVIADVDQALVRGDEPQKAKAADEAPKHLADLRVTHQDAAKDGAQAKTAVDTAAVHGKQDDATAAAGSGSAGAGSAERPAQAAELPSKSGGGGSSSSSGSSATDAGDAAGSSSIVLVAASQAFQSSTATNITFSSKDLVTVSIGASASDVLPLVPGSAATPSDNSSVTTFDGVTTAGAGLHLADNSSQLFNSLPGSNAKDLVRSIVTAFDQVNVYSYGTKFLFIVDTDVNMNNGDQIAFVNTQITDDITVAFIGTRAAFDAAGVFIA
ncbi:hypothetical protein [Pannonibacter tanglangensis]|uniref:Uncharacterized protein n=1 Tax=Pannonibacter tanglangensis TaxID=2750084 RepID=A0ABW9ZG08_9HYPH|nr:hypothetical protein [Pannonibacter sp. XCT-34]NBN63777.1 hypothetical protein [Pannonibacter sp. XCT-34]